MKRLLLIAVPLLLLVIATAYLTLQPSEAFETPPLEVKLDSS